MSSESPQHLLLKRLLNEGRLLFEKDQWSEALAAYGRVVGVDPANREARFMIACVYLNGGDFDNLHQAMALLRGLLSENPRDNDARIVLAGALSNAGGYCNSQKAYNRAIVMLRESVALDPDQPAAFLALGVAYIHKEDWDEAISACLRAIALRDDYAHAHANLGLVYLNKGNVAGAMASALRALQLDPPNQLAAGVLSRLGKT